MFFYVVWLAVYTHSIRYGPRSLIRDLRYHVRATIAILLFIALLHSHTVDSTTRLRFYLRSVPHLRPHSLHVSHHLLVPVYYLYYDSFVAFTVRSRSRSSAALYRLVTVDLRCTLRLSGVDVEFGFSRLPAFYVLRFYDLRLIYVTHVGYLRYPPTCHTLPDLHLIPHRDYRSTHIPYVPRCLRLNYDVAILLLIYRDLLIYRTSFE